MLPSIRLVTLRRLALLLPAAASLTAFGAAGAQIAGPRTPPTFPPNRTPQQALDRPDRSDRPDRPAPAVTASAASATVVELRWPRLPGAERYGVVRIGPTGAPVHLAASDDTAYTDAAVLPNTEFTYVVAAFYADAGIGSPVESKRVKVRTPTAPRPTSIRATATGLGKVSVEWAPVPGAYGYTVFRDNRFLNTEPITETSWRDAVPTPGKYTYFVIPIFRMQNYPVAGQAQTEEGTTEGGPRVVADVPRWSGMYRVVINGFSAYRETIDHALEVDGKKDEVYITVTTDVSKRGRAIDAGTDKKKRTPVMGFMGPTLHDPAAKWPGRIQAGTASAQGGIKPGDAYPHGKPWMRTSPAVYEDRLPLHVWTGALSEEGERAVVTPVIWEWDGGTDILTGVAQGWPTFHETLQLRLNQPECAQYAEIASAVDAVLPDVVSVLQDVLGKAGDRPIGMTQRNNNSSFRPKPLILTFESVERLLQSNPTGRGPGILELRFTEPAGQMLNGDYSLWIQVERVE